MTAADCGPLSAAQARALDAALAEQLAIPSLLLMENAGRGAAEAIARRFGGRDAAGADGRGVAVVLCGPGNNGGDGFVVARHLHRLGSDVVVLDAAADRPRRGDAAVMHAIATRLAATTGDGAPGFQLLPLRDPAAASRAIDAIPDRAIVIDALLGTGSDGPPRGLVAALLAELATRRPIRARVALDLPSGIDPASGRAAAVAFRADLTLAFAADKRCLHAADGPRLCGEVLVVDLGIERVTALRTLAATSAAEAHATGEADGAAGGPARPPGASH